MFPYLNVVKILGTRLINDRLVRLEQNIRFVGMLQRGVCQKHLVSFDVSIITLGQPLKTSEFTDCNYFQSRQIKINTNFKTKEESL